MEVLLIGGAPLTRETFVEVARRQRPVALDAEARSRMERSRRVVEEVARSSRPVYGITSGFGALADRWIPPADRRRLQLNLVRSHASAVGSPLPRDLVRAMMLVRAQGLAQGNSGVRPTIVETLLGWLNHDLVPFVPETGSVGASGDLAPLAHLAWGLVGEGPLLAADGRGAEPSAPALSRAGLQPLVLEEKEGISLVNGTSLMTAQLGLLLEDGHQLLRAAEFGAAMSFDALEGNLGPLDGRIQEARGLPAQIEEARHLRALLEGSELARTGEERGQDPYVLRCLPQVLGAVRQGLQWGEELFRHEVNASSDNPLVFGEEILGGGNFHGQPIALTLDMLALALSYVGSFSERRIARLVDAKLSRGLPPFLLPEAGVSSGYMIPPYVAAALVAEDRLLVDPASAASLPTSANQEDFNSQGATAGAKARRLLDNLSRIVAVELLLGAQALELRRPRHGGVGSESARAAVRRRAAALVEDRSSSADLERIARELREGSLVAEMDSGLGNTAPPG
jgi:histidine ammonia-lyase